MDALDLFDKIADYLFQLQGNISFKMRVINHIPRNDFTNVIELSNIQYCYDDSDHDDSDNELLRRALPPKFEAYIKTTNDEIKIIFSKLPSFKTWAYDEKGNSKQVYSNDQEKNKKQNGYLIELINGRKILWLSDAQIETWYAILELTRDYIYGPAIDDYSLTKSYRRSNITEEIIRLRSIATVKPIQYTLED